MILQKIIKIFPKGIVKKSAQTCEARIASEILFN